MRFSLKIIQNLEIDLQPVNRDSSCIRIAGARQELKWHVSFKDLKVLRGEEKVCVEKFSFS